MSRKKNQSLTYPKYRFICVEKRSYKLSSSLEETIDITFIENRTVVFKFI